MEENIKTFEMKDNIKRKKRKKTTMGSMLTCIRKAHGLTQEQVADILKIKRSTYAYYERDITPTLENISKLATLFNVSVHMLMYGCPDPRETGDFLNDIQIEELRKRSFGTLTNEERLLVSTLRRLPEPLKYKVIKDVNELAEKNESN